MHARPKRDQQGRQGSTPAKSQARQLQPNNNITHNRSCDSSERPWPRICSGSAGCSCLMLQESQRSTWSASEQFEIDAIVRLFIQSGHISSDHLCTVLTTRLGSGLATAWLCCDPLSPTYHRDTVHPLPPRIGSTPPLDIRCSEYTLKQHLYCIAPTR
ncbi:hypothetical protein BCV70DRAFT_11868 [Testicularia cyperi]|uniref:Uncharacterized protein n=1 Tax=Testicularia cyperi TaxID=1882483 RepID=A0A317Y0N5_9BASI|nr:hypothetical protein BCV70DRAFT_11868 [Testicularia cyperi]